MVNNEASRVVIVGMRIKRTVIVTVIWGHGHRAALQIVSKPSGGSITHPRALSRATRRFWAVVGAPGGMRELLLWTNG